VCCRASPIASISGSVRTPVQLCNRSLAMDRIWSTTATAGHPSQFRATRIGGWAEGELESGTTTTVRRYWLIKSRVMTTHGRILAISEPSVGSRAAHHTSPRRGVTPRLLYRVTDRVPLPFDYA